MGMAESTLYICDLDGTLLRSDATLSDFARDGINELIEAGVCLTVASARGTAGMRALLDGVRLQLPVIELNGAFVSDMHSGRHVASNILSEQDACAALGVILATGMDPVVSTWDGRRDRVHFGTRMNESISWYVEEKRKHRDPRLAFCDDLLAIAQTEEVAQITTFTIDQEAAVLTDRTPPRDRRGREGSRRQQRVLAGMDRSNDPASGGREGGGGSGPSRGLRHSRR